MVIVCIHFMLMILFHYFSIIKHVEWYVSSQLCTSLSFIRLEGGSFFVLLNFSKGFDAAIGELGHPFLVKIAEDRIITTSRVWTYSIFRERFLIDLIPVLVGEITVV